MREKNESAIVRAIRRGENLRVCISLWTSAIVINYHLG